MNDLQSLAQIAVIDDAAAAGLVSENTRADLAARVSAVPAGDARPGPARQPGRRTARRRLIARVPAAAAAAAAVLAAGLLARPGGIDSAHAALVITRHGRSVDVIVRNPRAVSADVQRFRHQLRADGVDVTIVLLPASPPMVGKYLGYGGDGRPGQQPGLGPLGKNGVRVSASFQGTAEIFIGRAAEPGEYYVLAEPATAPGEALAGLDLAGKTVADILPLLASASVTPVWLVEAVNSDGQVTDTPAGTVPGSYYVYDAVTYQPGKVQLRVGATPTPPGPQPEPTGSTTPAPGDTPTPSPS